MMSLMFLRVLFTFVNKQLKVKRYLQNLVNLTLKQFSPVSTYVYKINAFKVV